MKKGLLIYTEEDVKKNSSFIDWFITEGKETGLIIKILTLNKKSQLDEQPPLNEIDFVINRTRSYNLSLQFELSNIPVFNNSSITLYGNNKLAGYRLMKNLLIPSANILLNTSEKKNCIQKPIDGHGGKNIFKGNFENERLNPNIIHQEFIENARGDVRFWIIGNKIEHAVVRSNKTSFLSNYSLGGSFERFDYTKEHEVLIKRITDKISIDYAGIDFILTKDGGFLFNEIEDVVGSRMLSELGINDTVNKFLNHIKFSI
jgi:glutathione synthase/RimK-type ligase-like ATP-grasp enzyme